MRASKETAASSKPEAADERAPVPDAAPDQTEQTLGGRMDDIVPRLAHTLPVVGLGGSAGGIAALQTFFSHMAADSGMAFVVILPLSPEHQSDLASILRRVTAMPVVQVSEPTRVVADHVYVIPPGKHLTIARETLRLTVPERELGKHVAVDLFFRSLADSQGANATAIVLSGADGDGCIGIKRVKEWGGLTIAQDPREAEQDSMPRLAIATKMVDWVLPVAEMPARLLAYRRQEKRVRLPGETESSGPIPADARENEKALRDILALLHARVGSDFSHYKRATVIRRIGRRMQVNGIDEMTDYLRFLRAYPGEAGALLQDLLISVTNFFRDRDAFAALETEIPRLFEGKQANDTVRAWVAGCATGEETYSVAMLLREHAAKLANPPRLQVFATDLDEAAIGAARTAIYPDTIVADVSPERLQAFFVKDPRGYQVCAELRETVLFALHDLLRDPPFSRLDLITCRNLLIYLNREAQARAFDVFHYALHAGGMLFLGTSETADDEARLFDSLDKKFRLYLRHAAPRLAPPLVAARTSSLAPAGQPMAGDAALKLFDGPTHAAAATRLDARSTPEAGPAQPLTMIPGSLHFRLVERYAPPSVVVDADYRVVHLSEHAGRFVRLGGGNATLHLLKIVPPMLRLELRSALLRAAQSGKEVQARDVPVEIDGENRGVKLRVCPAEELAPGFLLVIFEEGAGAASELPSASGQESVDPGLHLEAALERLSAQQRESVEHYEASAAELKSANEELQSRNEELNAASEDLETGREELQSINEELTTVNQELKSKVEALAQANADLQNLMASTNIATVFLDRELRIQRYTPSAVRLFNLIPADTGRPLSDLSHRLDYPEITADAERVLAQLAGEEKEIHGPGGSWLLARMQPYRATEDRIAGVVLTFVDITERKRGEDELRVSEERFRTTTDSVPQIVWRGDAQGRVEFFNRRWITYTGVAELPVTLTELVSNFVHPDDAQAMLETFRTAQREAGPLLLEHRLRSAGGEYRWFLMQAEPQLEPQTGKVARWFGTCTDISERKGAEEALTATAERLRLAMDTARQGTWDWNMVSGDIFWSPEHNRMYDLPEDQQCGSFEEWLAHVHPEDRDATAGELRAAIDERRDFAAEMRSPHRDGSVRWILGNGRAFYDEAGKPVRMLGVVRDITVRKTAEAALRESEQRFRLANFHSPFPVMLHADDGEVLQVNDAWTHQTGYTSRELATVKDWIERAYATEEARNKAWAFLEELPQHLGAIESPARRVRCAAGEERIWDLSFANIGRLTDGRCLRITTAKDVTEQHRGEMALRLAKEEAERANLAKSEFLSRMSHELRTPLNAILGFGQLLELSPLPEQDAQCVDHILSGGRHLLAMIDEVLDLARIEAGELALKPVAVSLDKLARECVGFVAKLAHARSVTCIVERHGALQLQALVDEQRLRQVLLNLLSNAIKYNLEGGTVTLDCEQVSADRVRLKVRDTGPGISPEGLARLFVPFERLGQELGAVEGTGLGLVVSRQLVEAMGGTLGAESELGRGSTFWVELPKAVESGPQMESGAGNAGTAGADIRATENLPPATLLYVEDNASNLQVMKTVVARLRPHWRFLSAKDGPSGLEQAREYLPGLILLDMQLPGLRGDAVLAELRKDVTTREIPVLMLSADATEHSRESLLALGANDYLSKPFNIDDLLAKLDAMLLRTSSRATDHLR